MTLTNHVLSGVVLAKFLPAPIAIPLAFVSHFVLDALPHYGYPKVDGRNVNQQRNKVFLGITAIDVLLTITIALWLISIGHGSWLIIGLIAYSPDLYWVYRYIFQEKFGTKEPNLGNRFVQFHRNIQKYERVWGVYVEMVYCAGLILLIGQ